MCLIFVSHDPEGPWPLVVAANRDEFFARPALAADFWTSDPGILGGRDLKEGGGWLALRRDGRFACVTNYRDPQLHKDGRKSRGAIVANLLRSKDSLSSLLSALRAERREYNAFNLLAGEGDALWFYGSEDDDLRKLTPGLYGLSNASLDTPWPKVEHGKAEMALALQAASVGQGGPLESNRLALRSALLTLLSNEQRAADSELPGTGIPLEAERALSARFIRLPGYGTRASTTVIKGDGRLEFFERSFDADGKISDERRHELQSSATAFRPGR
ncbi:MAG: NRDE family protein [Leptospirales bacterium]|nr:NRDE family protein [Leptospirales bacterium]